MKRYRVTIDIPGAPNITVTVEAHTHDEARRIAHAQYPTGTIITTVEE